MFPEALKKIKFHKRQKAGIKKGPKNHRTVNMHGISNVFRISVDSNICMHHGLKPSVLKDLKSLSLNSIHHLQKAA